MTPLTVSVKKLHPQAILPRYMTAGAAGLDLCAALDQALHLAPGERRLVPTGIALAIPAGFEGQVRPRSGLALRQGLTMLNSPGTIDSDFRGEIGLIVINHGQEEAVINPGDRVGQLVIAPIVRAQLVEVEQLDDTCRGIGGFGHTGSSGGF
ncbi:dUTP diphosphatase [Desulfuromonas carbonis]|uniref:dUTP diphosphatase n=1 Tax=Desulfuromonas sp. DDH964 TaxID=1823759 RepID=UPI00078C390F|nr:dUTP diphosphatase [Desulfuromonas sp. DDH964]AMV72088.1 deoxyuridine 5'-triphosphate nucleotidohydrolase [Desulfuromonas sp. DDH964]